MKKTNMALEMKKRTLEAWARLLCDEGMIDIARCSRMIDAIGKLTS